MNVLVLLLLSVVVISVAARIYGRLVARWLGENPARPTPATTMTDGRDYVPTNSNVLFAHHFSAIAGAGPIVGPTMAVLYGYLPVWLWILVGGVLFGAVHDFSTLFVSLRERGRSMAEIARTTLGERGFALFLGFAAVMILLVTSSFLSMTAMSLTSMPPISALGLQPGHQHLLREVATPPAAPGGEPVVKVVIGGIASTSVIIITLFAPLLGWLLYRRNLRTRLGYLLAIVVAAGSIMAGLHYPISLNAQVWMLLVSIYVLFAAGVPVWLILHPRDFINVQILYAGIIAMVAGLCIGGFQGMALPGNAVAIQDGVNNLGAVWPMLFITVACGAISGFHALVATGTTSKQLAKEGHARILGFNGMLLESLMAIAALLVIAAALPRELYMATVWPMDPAVKSNPILAFSLGLGRLLHDTMHIPAAYGTVFGILLIEGFVVTTLDAAVRLNRYLFEELWPILFKHKVPACMRHPWFNSGLSVALMLLLAWYSAFTFLWPLFATGNQMLAALSLMAVSAWLLSRKRQAWFTLLPALFMIGTTFASLLLQFKKFVSIVLPALRSSPASVLSDQLFGPTLLLAVDIIMLLLAAGVVFLLIKAVGSFRSQHTDAVPREPAGV
jgi:carbon starvation protein